MSEAAGASRSRCDLHCTWSGGRLSIRDAECVDILVLGFGERFSGAELPK